MFMPELNHTEKKTLRHPGSMLLMTLWYIVTAKRLLKKASSQRNPKSHPHKVMCNERSKSRQNLGLSVGRGTELEAGSLAQGKLDYPSTYFLPISSRKPSSAISLM